MALSSGTSAVTPCASVSERIHSSSSNCFEVGSFSFFKKTSCVLRRNSWQVSCPPFDCENVELPKQVFPLAGSCEGDDGIQVFPPFARGTRSTHWRQFDMRQRSDTVLLRPCSLIALRAILYLPLPQAIRAASAYSANARAPWDESCSPVPAAISRACAAAPTSPFMTLLMDPRAVRAHARFQRCSSVCGCTLLAVLRSGPEFC